MKRFVLCCAVATLALARPAFVPAGVINMSSTVIAVPAPPDTRTGHWESDTHIRLFNEQQQVTLDRPIDVSITQPGTYNTGSANLTPGTIAAGTVVSSYFLHFDDIGQQNNPVQITGFVTFSSDILGIIVGSQKLDASDAMPGLPTTIYAESDSWRGLDLDVGTDSDAIALSADRRTVTLWLQNFNLSDDVRVITAVPEPSTLALIASGVAGLVLAAWRHARRH